METTGTLDPYLILAAGVAAGVLAGLMIGLYSSRANRKVIAGLQKSKAEHEAQISRTEQELAAVKKKYEPLLAASTEGYCDWDLDRKVVHCSPALLRMLEYEQDLPPFDDTWFTELFHPDDRAMSTEIMQTIIDGRRKYFELEVRMRARIIGYKWFLIRGRIVERDDRGKALRMLGTVSDIGERLSAVESHHRLRSLLHDIIDSLPSAIIAFDKDDRIELWNNVATRNREVHLNGLTVGADLSGAFPGMKIELDEMLARLHGGESPVARRVIRSDGGHHRVYACSMYPMVGQAPEGGLLHLEDITEMVRLQDLMVQNEKMMTVGGLAAGMAHEINNPLGIIMQGAQVAIFRLSEEIDANHRAAEASGIDFSNLQDYLNRRGIFGYLNGIREAGARASRIVQSMLNFSRNSGMKKQDCDINHLLLESVELAASDYDLKKKYDFRKIRMNTDLSASLPSVWANSTELQQVFLNLLKNAAQALSLLNETTEHTITISTATEDGFVRIVIADNGPGINPKDLKRVFEPFFTTKPTGDGTGLGLAVSYFIITTNHRGTIDVQSEPGSGTICTIRLPSG